MRCRIAVGLLCVGVAANAATAPHGSISGRVFAADRPVGARQMMGRPVFLVPVNEQTTAFYDSLRSANRPAEYGVGPAPRSRRAMTDERGRFRFGRVSPGDYYLYAQVRWPVPVNVGWGASSSMQTIERIVLGRVTVQAGQKVECVLEPADK